MARNKGTIMNEYKERKACKGCKILGRTNCDILEHIDNTEMIIGQDILFTHCPFREMAIRLMKMDIKNGNHYEKVGK